MVRRYVGQKHTERNHQFIGLVLGLVRTILFWRQVKTDKKSNEITAIPELLEILNITGNTITIDAIV